MSGVFGVINKRNNLVVGELLNAMGKEMTHRPWYQVDTFCDEAAGIGLGRIGIGIFNQERQPICSEDLNLTVFLTGEFYRTAELRHDLKAKGHRFRDDSDLELVLRLYREKGKEFIQDLEGAFLVMIWDRSKQEVIIANDRFGMYPLFYAHYGGKFIFAPEMKGILCNPGFDKKLNLAALAEYMRFQQLLGEKTFFEDITLLPPASILRVDYEILQLTRHNYWDWCSIRLLDKGLDVREVAEEGERLFRRAVNIRLERAKRPGVLLSGGLDSRTILAVANPQYRPITTTTYGHRDCRDVYLAARIARVSGTQHHFFELKDGNWVKEVADFHLDLTEGAHSWVHAHGMSTLPQVRELMDVNLSGIAGPIGGPVLARPSIVYAPDGAALLNNLFLFYNQQHTWPGLTEAEAKNLYTDHYKAMLNGLAYDSFRMELAHFDHLDIRLQGLFFNLTNRDRRLIFNFIIFNNSHFENRCPFYDYQFVNWAICLPVEHKTNKQFHYSLIKRAAPRMSLIPKDKNLQLPTNNRFLWGIHAAYDRVTQILGKQLGFAHPRLTLYADYENYLRRELREWGENILFDKRTLDRGIFNPGFLRSIWARHQSGKELHTIGKIAPIITFEMMMRRFFD